MFFTDVHLALASLEKPCTFAYFKNLSAPLPLYVFQVHDIGDLDTLNII